MQVEQFLGTFGTTSLYGQNDFTLQSLLLTVLPQYFFMSTEESVEIPSINGDTLLGTTSKEEFLLNCLLVVTTQKLNFSFPKVMDGCNYYYTDNSRHDPYVIFIGVGSS